MSSIEFLNTKIKIIISTIVDVCLKMSYFNMPNIKLKNSLSNLNSPVKLAINGIKIPIEKISKNIFKIDNIKIRQNKYFSLIDKR